MNIDFFGALRYPYKKENRFNIWLLPSLVTLVCSGLVVFLNSQLLALLFAVVGNLLVFGYLWQLSERYHHQQMSANALAWSGPLVIDGLKIYPYFIASYLLVTVLLAQPFAGYFESDFKYVAVAWVVAICAAIYLLPVLVAPVIYSAQTRSFRQLINFPLAFHFMSSRYGQCNQAMLFVFFLLFVYVAVFVILVNVMVSIGLPQYLFLIVPFGVFPLLFSTWHLINQGFLNPLEDT